MMGECCDAVENCQPGTECYETEMCRRDYCDDISGDAMLRCLVENCPDFGPPALNYWMCRSESCEDSCY
jgi:hypothetical protein